jgi:hypothetical protein
MSKNGELMNVLASSLSCSCDSSYKTDDAAIAQTVKILFLFWQQPPFAKMLLPNAHKAAFACVADAIIDGDMRMSHHFARCGAFMRTWQERGEEAFLADWLPVFPSEPVEAAKVAGTEDRKGKAEPEPEPELEPEPAPAPVPAPPAPPPADTEEAAARRAPLAAIFRAVSTEAGLLDFIRSELTCGCLEPAALAGLSGVCLACQTRKPKSDLKVCSRCKSVQYCSAECQKKDWKHHKKKCVAAQPSE